MAAGQGDLEGAPGLRLARARRPGRGRPPGRSARGSARPVGTRTAGTGQDELDPGRSLAGRRRDDAERIAASAAAEVGRRRHLDPVDEPGLDDPVGRHDDPAHAAPGEGGDHRQDAGHRPELAAERQLADQRPAAGRPDLLGTEEDRRRRSPRSSDAPVLRRSAGARLTVIRRGG